MDFLKPSGTMIFLALFGFFLAAALASTIWHALPVSIAAGPEASLAEYDFIAYKGEKPCFTLEFFPSTIDINKSTKIFAYSSGKPLSADNWKFIEGKNLKKICFESDALAEGDNLVEIFAFYNNLYYHLEKKAVERVETGKPEIALSGIENSVVSFDIKNPPEGKFVPAEIFVNGKLDHRVFLDGKEKEFKEKISLGPGKNTVKIAFDGAEQAAEAEAPQPFTMPFVFGILLLAFSVFVFCCFVFPEYGLYKRLALGLAFTAAALMLLVFALGLLGILNVFSLNACFAALLIAIAAWRRKAFSLKIEREFKIEKIELLGLAIFVLISIAFHIFTFQHMTYWNGFYERMGSMITEQNAIPTSDPLSYFGRGYTFVPGYFYLNAGISWLSGLDGTMLFALIMSFSNLLFFLACLYLGKSLELSKKQSVLFALLIVTESFLLTAIVLSPRHALSFALFILAAALLFDKKSPLLAGFVLGLMAFLQAPLLIFFPLFAFFASKKFDLKKTAITFAVAGLMFGLLFLPNLLRYGMPYQVESEDWGYLIKAPLSSMLQDFAPLIGFFVLFYLPDIWKKNVKLSPYQKKLGLGIILGFIIQTFITYRYNIVTSLSLGILLALLFPAEKMKDIHFERLVMIALLAAFAVALSMVSTFSVQGIATQPMDYLKYNTPSSARILSDPLFGHSIAYFAGRAVLSDLHVEYADAEKLGDTYRFLEEKDYSVLEKYSIDFTVNQADYINRQATSGQLLKDPVEFRELDKVYANGFLFIHRNRGQ
ncbi:MAG: hypothetical protein NT067_01875 [Candidatus Diapherotrites archaeon]|nr:hypothetical protein [Candidatus Diapherotrites archaeon]